MRSRPRRRAGSGLALLLACGVAAGAHAQPTVVDPVLAIETIAPPGLLTPTGMRFLGPDDFFVIEKTSGKVKRVRSPAEDGEYEKPAMDRLGL